MLNAKKRYYAPLNDSERTGKQANEHRLHHSKLISG